MITLIWDDSSLMLTEYDNEGFKPDSAACHSPNRKLAPRRKH